MRAGHHHPGGSDGRVRDVVVAAASHPYVGRGGARRQPGRAGRPSRRARPARRERPGPVRRRERGAGWRTAPPHRRRCAQPRLPAAHAGGAVPAALRPSGCARHRARRGDPMSTLTGTGRLIRLALRRDRVLLPLWVLVPSIFPAVFVVAFTTAFPTPQALQEYAETSIHNAAFTVFYGALQGPSLGELVTWRAGFVPVVIGLFSLLAVYPAHPNRGRDRPAPAGRLDRRLAPRGHGRRRARDLRRQPGHRPAVGSDAGRSTSLPVAGSLAHGTGIAAVGCVFAAVGAVVAQLTTGAGSARGIVITVLGVAFLLRGIGDVSAQSGGALGWISWLSPIGWASQLRPVRRRTLVDSGGPLRCRRRPDRDGGRTRRASRRRQRPPALPARPGGRRSRSPQHPRRWRGGCTAGRW